MTKTDSGEYLKLIKERSKKSRISTSHQMTGLILAEILRDEKHKSLYMKLAKKHDHDFLIRTAKDIADRKGIKNEGAYFMAVLHGKINAEKGGETRKNK